MIPLIDIIREGDIRRINEIRMVLLHGRQFAAELDGQHLTTLCHASSGRVTRRHYDVLLYFFISSYFLQL